MAAVLTAAPGDRAATPTGPGPSAPTSAPTSTGHANGPLFGGGSRYLRFPRGAYVPPLTEGSSPTWSPDGSEVAVLADGGILVTDVENAATRTVRCDDCVEIAWSPDGRTFAAVGTGAAVPALRLVDATTGQREPRGAAGRHGGQVGLVVTGLAGPWPSWPRRRSRSREGGRSAPTGRADAVPGHADGLPGRPTSGDTGALRLRWSPTSASIAVLFATADGPGPHAADGPFRLDVLTMHPDGARPNHLVYVGTAPAPGSRPTWSGRRTGRRWRRSPSTGRRGSTTGPSPVWTATGTRSWSGSCRAADPSAGSRCLGFPDHVAGPDGDVGSAA